MKIKMRLHSACSAPSVLALVLSICRERHTFFNASVPETIPSPKRYCTRLSADAPLLLNTEYDFACDIRTSRPVRRMVLMLMLGGERNKRKRDVEK